MAVQDTTYMLNVKIGETWYSIPVIQGPAGADGTVSFDELTSEQKAMLKGDQGEQGPKGDPFTYSDFTPAQLEALTGPAGATGATGATGPAGANGTDGYTPVRGVDYWTSSDQTAIVNEVLAALPSSEGVGY